MQYYSVVPGIFRARPNRFIAHVDIGGENTVCHVKNTGRCRELLQPGTQVWCQTADNPNRKTKFDLIAVQKGHRLINMDSQAPNAAAKEWLLSSGLGEIKNLRSEAVWEDSRFDFAFVRAGIPCLLEVKGVTLEADGICAFPDAPTQRGVKHLHGLTRAAQTGLQTFVLFVIQMADVRFLHPNAKTDPAFSIALQEAANAGVQLLAMDCSVTPESMTIRKPVPILLTPSADDLIG